MAAKNLPEKQNKQRINRRPARIRQVRGGIAPAESIPGLEILGYLEISYSVARDSYSPKMPSRETDNEIKNQEAEKKFSIGHPL
jgi:hypothetical protein